MVVAGSTEDLYGVLFMKIKAYVPAVFKFASDWLIFFDSVSKLMGIDDVKEVTVVYSTTKDLSEFFRPPDFTTPFFFAQDADFESCLGAMKDLLYNDPFEGAILIFPQNGFFPEKMFDFPDRPTRFGVIEQNPWNPFNVYKKTSDVFLEMDNCLFLPENDFLVYQGIIEGFQPPFFDTERVIYTSKGSIENEENFILDRQP